MFCLRNLCLTSFFFSLMVRKVLWESPVYKIRNKQLTPPSSSFSWWSGRFSWSQTLLSHKFSPWVSLVLWAHVRTRTPHSRRALRSERVESNVWWGAVGLYRTSCAALGCSSFYHSFERWKIMGMCRLFWTLCAVFHLSHPLRAQISSDILEKWEGAMGFSYLSLKAPSSSAFPPFLLFLSLQPLKIIWF